MKDPSVLATCSPQEVGDVVFGSGLGPSSKRANEASQLPPACVCCLGVKA